MSILPAIPYHHRSHSVAHHKQPHFGMKVSILADGTGDFETRLTSAINGLYQVFMDGGLRREGKGKAPVAPLGNGQALYGEEAALYLALDSLKQRLEGSDHRVLAERNPETGALRYERFTPEEAIRALSAIERTMWQMEEARPRFEIWA